MVEDLLFLGSYRFPIGDTRFFSKHVRGIKKVNFGLLALDFLNGARYLYNPKTERAFLIREAGNFPDPEGFIPYHKTDLRKIGNGASKKEVA